MLQRLSEYISFQLIVNQIIDIDEKDIYVYGIQLTISTLFTSISILILGIFIEELVLAIIYLSVYLFLKSYTGGYHAKHYYGCYIYSMITYIALLFIKNTTLDNYKPIIGLISLILSIIIIFKFAPIENKNNPKTKLEIIRNRRIARNRTIFLNIFIVLGYIIVNGLINLWFMVAITELSLAYSILKQKFLEGREDNE